MLKFVEILIINSFGGKCFSCVIVTLIYVWWIFHFSSQESHYIQCFLRHSTMIGEFWRPDSYICYIVMINSFVDSCLYCVLVTLMNMSWINSQESHYILYSLRHSTMIGEFLRPGVVEPKMTAPAAAVEDLTSEHWKDGFRQLLCNT